METDDELLTVVGNLSSAAKGTCLELTGTFKNHPRYGEQFVFTEAREVLPTTRAGIEGFLASGIIKGIGPKTAGAIVAKFGEETLQIIEKQPERLCEVPGIGLKKADVIAASFAEHREFADVSLFFQGYGVSAAQTLRLYKGYGKDAVSLIREITGGRMAVVYVIVGFLLGFALISIARTVMPIFRRIFKKYDALNESVEENVTGIRVVKSFVREEYENKKFQKASGEVFQDFWGAERILAWNQPIMTFAVDTIYAFVVYFGSKTIVSTAGAAMNVGQMSALITYGFSMLMSLNMLSMIFVMITMAEESSRRICEVLLEQPDLANPANPVYEVADGSIDFDNVSFAYHPESGRYALHDIDLHIKSGEVIGVIGGTGSSKSTLIQLISRLYDATQGTVRVGGLDVRAYDMDTLRNEVAVVLQRNVLFSGTIKDNLRWGNEHATDEELVEACKLAQADEFVQQFPDGYDTYIEQGGTNVSGGQKQRLCIARALLKKIRQGFRSFIPETTKIIIAQRTGSVEDADRIIVMDDGGISAVGTHEELLRTSEIYREVYLTQNKASHDENAIVAESDKVTVLGKDEVHAHAAAGGKAPQTGTSARDGLAAEQERSALDGQLMEGGDLNA